jgi:hypothetical protein
MAMSDGVHIVFHFNIMYDVQKEWFTDGLALQFVRVNENCRSDGTETLRCVTDRRTSDV